MKNIIKSLFGKHKPTSAEIVAKRIAEMPLDPLYSPVEDLPIPTELGVLIKKLPKPKGSNEVYVAEGDNSREPTLGIIMAVGPRVSEFIKVGLRCYYDCNQTGTFRHKGVNYMRMDCYAVYFIVPSADTVDEVTLKEEKEVIRARSKEKQAGVYAAISRDEQNELDEKRDEIKGKIR